MPIVFYLLKIAFLRQIKFESLMSSNETLHLLYFIFFYNMENEQATGGEGRNC